MQFTENNNEKGYTYKVEDAFGTITISSPERLVKNEGGKVDAGFLDDVFMAIYNAHKDEPAQIITQTVKDTDINYTFEKRPLWEDLEDGKQKININYEKEN